MRCPRCNNPTNVNGTKRHSDTLVERYRVCGSCGYSFTAVAAETFAKECKHKRTTR